ncbi:MAG: HAMP domain-containing histidine kinase [Candidatus Caenarcaniphilales bacterium]|nr:HAMP domain-containing histidine kinase [Candidatus Caenarcaniphilales bacterium]
MINFIEEINDEISDVSRVKRTTLVSDYFLNFTEEKSIVDCVNLLKPFIKRLTDLVLVLDTNLSVLYNNSPAKLFLQRRTKILFEAEEYDFAAFIEKIVMSSSLSYSFEDVKITVKHNISDYHNLSFDFMHISSNDKVIGFLFKAKPIEGLKKDFSDVQDLLCSFVHDLKTPLTATKINLENLITDSNSAIQNKNLLEKLYHSHNESLDLVNSMLSVLKYDVYSSKKAIECHSIAEVLYKCLKNIEVVSLSSNITINLLNIDNSIYVRFNYNEIQRVITSLMMNCISFLKENGLIDIDIKMLDKKFIQVKLLAKSKQKLDSNSKNNFISPYLKNYESSFSLYLIKRIIENYGGTLWVNSTSPNNIEFAFLLQVESEAKTQNNSSKENINYG